MDSDKAVPLLRMFWVCRFFDWTLNMKNKDVAKVLLRNIGFNQDRAIHYRHIIKNLKRLGVIATVPESLTKRQYLAIETKMKEFSEAVHVPMSHLDFVLWYKETGEILK